MSPFERAEFSISAGTAAEFPRHQGPEFALAGRSNVGKSSALNALANRRRLAFVSKTPGRTQTVNFYSLGAQGAYLVDLPGYGYAKVPMELRARWDELAGGYLAQREQLAGLILIMDARRPFTPSDLQMLRWAAQRAQPLGRLLVLLSKADKLSRSAGAVTLADVRKRLASLPGAGEARLFSSLSKQGVVEVRALLESWIPEADDNPPNPSSQPGQSGAGTKNPR